MSAQSMRVRADLVAERARRAWEHGSAPFQVKLPHGWRTVVGGAVVPGEGVLLDLLPDQMVRLTDPREVVWVRWGLTAGQTWVEAADLLIGDEVHNLGNVAWTVQRTRTRPGEGAAEGRTWVVLTGDSADHFYARNHGGPLEYLAAPDEPVAVTISEVHR